MVREVHIRLVLEVEKGDCPFLSTRMRMQKNNPIL